MAASAAAIMPVPFRAEISTTLQPSWRESFSYIDLIAVFLYQVHHVDGDDDRDAQLGQLGG